MDSIFQGRGAREAGRASEKIDSLGSKLDVLNTDVRAALVEIERLGAVQKALWTLVSAKLGLTEEELLQQIKLATPAAPEKALDEPVREALKCKNCGRPLNRGRNACIYCGTDNADILLLQVVKDQSTKNGTP